jgi:hypothetical protein
MGHKLGRKVKLLLIGGVVGLVIGVALTVFYFSLATFFFVQAKALDEQQKVEEARNKNAQDASATDKGQPAEVGHIQPWPYRRDRHLPKDKSRKSEVV